MSQLKYSANLSELIPQATAHGSGEKLVFRSNEQMPHVSTQIAFGIFKPGEICDTHLHPTMYEYFYFIRGKGTYVIENLKIDLIPNTFLEIPAGCKHSLHADKGVQLEFLYWGIALD